MVSNLNEGMRPGDLEDLILPMVSIDEYESKLDDDAVVMGFYVHDKDAADDLNRFVQKSPIQLLDTEVSPAPDQHGYYLVFIELLNDDRIVDNIQSILDDVTPLCQNEEWQMRLRGAPGVEKFSAKKLGKRFAELRNDSDALHTDETEGRVLEFLTFSDLQDAVIENARLTLKGEGSTFRGELVALGENETVLKTAGLTEAALSLDLTDIAETMKITRLLGEGWVFSKMGIHSVIQRSNSDLTLILRNASFI